MFRLDKKFLAALAAVVLVILFSVVGSTAQAAFHSGDDYGSPMDTPEMAPVLDHYWCYHTTSTPVNEQVGLKDQFTTAVVPHNVGAPERFCNPVKKKHGDKVFKVIDPNAHLILYDIGAYNAILNFVQVKNQFGTQKLKVLVPAEDLAVPTMIVGTPAPPSLDHFKCYRVKGDGVQQTVDLKDMFTSGTGLVVGKPVLLCNPTIKVHGDKTYDILHPAAHLVCYNVTRKQFTTQVATNNQFRAEVLTIQNPDMLCAPSQKKILD